jgi:DNA-binding transcriptional LysR family regulator
VGQHGLGIALLPHFITPDRHDLARLTVTGADLRWPMSLAVPAARTPSAAARALITMIEQAGRNDTADKGADLPERDGAGSGPVRRKR